MSNATTTLTLGDRIRIAINTSGLTLEQIGAELGVTSKTVGRWQQHKGIVPKFDHLVRLAHLTGYTVGFFADAITGGDAPVNRDHHLAVIVGGWCDPLPGQVELPLDEAA